MTLEDTAYFLRLHFATSHQNAAARHSALAASLRDQLLTEEIYRPENDGTGGNRWGLMEIIRKHQSNAKYHGWWANHWRDRAIQIRNDFEAGRLA